MEYGMPSEIQFNLQSEALYSRRTIAGEPEAILLWAVQLMAAAIAEQASGKKK